MIKKSPATRDARSPLAAGTLGFRFYFNFFFFFVLFRTTRRLKVSGGSRGRTSAAAGHRQVLPRRFD